MRRNIQWSRRRFPDVSEGPLRDHPISLVASGPSARAAPLDGVTMAVNGSLGLFTAQGQQPTFWAGCDPQAHMADFLRDPPPDTIYLVASKCHPSVFKALRGRRVRLWHIDDVPGHPWAIPTATTISLTGLSLLRRLGYRDIDVYGWDCCYIDGLDHALPQIHQGDNVTVEVGERKFLTTGTWALEAQEAVLQLSDADMRVKVHGPGMCAAILDALAPHVRTRPIGKPDVLRYGPACSR